MIAQFAMAFGLWQAEDPRDTCLWLCACTPQSWTSIHAYLFGHACERWGLRFLSRRWFGSGTYVARLGLRQRDLYDPER